MYSYSKNDEKKKEKNKMKNGLKRITKKEKRFEKYEKEYEKGYEESNLSEEQLRRLPYEKIKEYLIKNLRIKYKDNNIKYSCMNCACDTLFNDSGYITDDELLSNEKINKHFKPK